MEILLDTTNLAKRWCAAYGISTRRYEAFLRRPKTVGGREPDSFYSHTSETVVTLFALGRADRWLQASGAEGWQQLPRPNGTSWNKGFFSTLRKGTISVPVEVTPLRRLLAEVLRLDEGDFANAVLLFELEASGNRALSTTDRAIDVQDITFCRRWNKGTIFDAVLAMTDVKRLICIEAKMNARQGKSQIIRGLEAAFFLTKVDRSMFEGWDYSYLFLHPPGKQYDNDYEFVSDPNRALAKYGDELSKGAEEANDNFSEGTLWQEFLSNAPSRIYERAWPDVLQTIEQDGWNEAEYHRRIGESQLPFPDELVAASKNRLKIARGRTDLDDVLDGLDANKLAGNAGRPDRDRRVRQADRLARILNVLRLIQSRGKWNAKSIAEELEVTERTVYRDLQALEFAGVPWYFDEVEQCYRVRADYRFPVPNLTEEEVIGQAVATAITKASGLDVAGNASATTHKIAATADDDTKQLLADIEQVVCVLGLQLADHSHCYETIEKLQNALIEKRQIAGTYSSPHEASPVDLRLNPIRLCLIKNAWYLIAQAIDGEPKTYRVARFGKVEVLDAAAVVPPNFDVRAYFGNAWAVFRGARTYDIQVRFLPDAARIVTETQWHATQQATPAPDGSVVLSFRIDGLEEICNWLLGWSGRAEVLEPLELRQMVAAKLRSGLELNQ